MMLLNCLPLYLLSSMFIFSTVGTFVEGIFYRNIPFRYKTTESANSIDNFGTKEEMLNDNNNNNRKKDNSRSEGEIRRGLMDEIETEESRLLRATAANDDGAISSRRSSLPPRRTARLIALLPFADRAANSANIEPIAREIGQRQNAIDAEEDGEEEAYGSGNIRNSNPTVPAPSAQSASLHSLAALRPDYAFKNVADFFRNFFDSRIERSRKSAADKGKKRGRPSAFSGGDWWARSMSI